MSSDWRLNPGTGLGTSWHPSQPVRNHYADLKSDRRGIFDISSGQLLPMDSQLEAEEASSKLADLSFMDARRDSSSPSTAAAVADGTLSPAAAQVHEGVASRLVEQIAELLLSTDAGRMGGEHPSPAFAPRSPSHPRSRAASGSLPGSPRARGLSDEGGDATDASSLDVLSLGLSAGITNGSARTSMLSPLPAAESPGGRGKGGVPFDSNSGSKPARKQARRAAEYEPSGEFAPAEGRRPPAAHFAGDGLSHGFEEAPHQTNGAIDWGALGLAHSMGGGVLLPEAAHKYIERGGGGSASDGIAPGAGSALDGSGSSGSSIVGPGMLSSAHITEAERAFKGDGQTMRLAGLAGDRLLAAGGTGAAAGGGIPEA